MKHPRAVRWMLPIAASAGVLLLLAALLIHWHHGSIVNRVNYNRIANGMSRAEVETILGAPFPDLAPLGTVDIHADESEMLGLLRRWQAEHKDILTPQLAWQFSTWYDGRHLICLTFDSSETSGRVITRSYSRRHDAWWLFRKLDELGL